MVKVGEWNVVEFGPHGRVRDAVAVCVCLSLKLSVPAIRRELW